MSIEAGTASDGNSDRLRALLQSGGQVVGNVAGAALAVIAGPLLGAGAGVAMGEALARVGAELHDRVLAPRQFARVGGAMGEAAIRIGQRLEAGETFRDDGFFDSGPHHRAAAEEVLEGTLVTAARAWEERKVAPLGRLYANLAFEESISPQWANFLLGVVDGLTYTQLVLLAVIAEANRDGAYGRAMVNLAAVASEVRTPPDATLYAQLDGLSAANLVGVRLKSGPAVPLSETFGGGAWRSNTVERASLMPTGETLHTLMDLDLLPREDLDAVLVGLRGDRDP